MSFDTNRFTQKSQEAIIAAQNAAERNGNSQVEPEHLLLALLDQGDGVVPQVLIKLNLAVGMCGQGLMLGPGLGELIARTVKGSLTKEDQEVLAILSPHRQFAGQEKLK